MDSSIFRFDMVVLYRTIEGKSNEQSCLIYTKFRFYYCFLHCVFPVSLMYCHFTKSGMLSWKSESLARTFVISGAVVAADVLLKVLSTPKFRHSEQ